MADKKKFKPPEKKLYDIKVEVTLPATITYRILAESPEEAIELVVRNNPINVKYVLNKKRSLKATVYDAGTTIIRFVKAYVR